MSEEQKSAALVVPDYLKAMTGSQMPNAAVDSLASAAVNIPRVSMRGKKFRFLEGGEEVLAVNDAIEVVIIGVEPDANRFTKAYYSQPYGGANQNNPPDCASDDGVVPSGWISNPQSRTCAECPKNRFGSAMSRTGKPAKACRDSKRLWITRREEIGKTDKPMLYALGVPVTSLKNLAEFGRGLKGLNVPIAAAICKVTMDDDSEFPLINFSCVGFLPETEAKAMISRSDKAEWKLGQVTRSIQAPAPMTQLPGQPQAATAPAATPQAASAPAPQTQAQAPVQAATPAEPKQANMDDILKNW